MTSNSWIANMVGIVLFVCGLLISYPFPDGHEFSFTSIVLMSVGGFLVIVIFPIWFTLDRKMTFRINFKERQGL